MKSTISHHIVDNFSEIMQVGGHERHVHQIVRGKW